MPDRQSRAMAQALVDCLEEGSVLRQGRGGNGASRHERGRKWWVIAGCAAATMIAMMTLMASAGLSAEKQTTETAAGIAATVQAMLANQPQMQEALAAGQYDRKTVRTLMDSMEKQCRMAGNCSVLLGYLHGERFLAVYGSGEFVRGDELAKLPADAASDLRKQRQTTVDENTGGMLLRHDYHLLDGPQVEGTHPFLLRITSVRRDLTAANAEGNSGYYFLYGGVALLALLGCIHYARKGSAPTGESPRSGSACATAKSGLRKNGGFTLIEMLVVVAIIAILAGMLMGPVNAALGSGRGAGCLNNMRQIGIGVNTYASNFDQYIPRSYVYWPHYTAPAAERKLVRWYHAIWTDFQTNLPDIKLYQCPNGHQAEVPADDSYYNPRPIVNYAWNSMRRDKDYYPIRDADDAEDPGAYGLSEGDGTMSCQLYMKLGKIAPNTLVIVDGGLGDRSTGVGKALVELSSLYTARYYNGYDWRDAATREEFTQTLPGANYCHNGGLNGLSIDGSGETLRRTPFHRFTNRADTEDTTP